MRGASFHLKPMTRPAASHAHNTRTWSDEHQPPGYLLPAEHSLGARRVIDVADVLEVHAKKLAKASGKARSMAEYSPVHEGVLNLDHPVGDGADLARFGDQVRAFCEGYERLTGHKVLAADVHLDEGRVEGGQPVYNSHAHITVDRTDDRGRPIRLDKAQLRAVQDLAAECTGLARGEDARETRRRHLPHQAWRGLARAGAVRSRETIALDRADDVGAFYQLAIDYVGEYNRADHAVAAIPAAELYGELRGLMKASGQATREAYSAARQHREDRDWLTDQVSTWSARAEAARKAAEAALAEAERARDAAYADGLRAAATVGAREVLQVQRERDQARAQIDVLAKEVLRLQQPSPPRTHGRDGPTR